MESNDFAFIMELLISYLFLFLVILGIYILLFLVDSCCVCSFDSWEGCILD